MKFNTTGGAAAKPAGSKTGAALRGSAAKAAMKAAQAQSMTAPTPSNSNRFWLPVGGEARITFVDGLLDDDGALDFPVWYEHRLWIGRSVELVCYETDPERGPCPVCQAGHRTQFVGGFTIINQTPYTIQKGPNAGTTLGARQMLFVAPRKALETLQTLAGKRGGLSGHTFDVYRKENMDPRCGSVFDYIGPASDSDIAGWGEEYTPIDYDEVVKFVDEDEMEKFGQAAQPYEASAVGKSTFKV
jgi:hypothetical protein